MKIDVISGFLGAGKTTLIKKLIQQNKTNEKILIIENEVGEENIDAIELSQLKIKIREITSGCICCSLSINLIQIIEEISSEKSLDRIIIEPSGVAMLSDILNLFDSIKTGDIKVNLLINILDISNLEEFAGRFGMFFSDQIINSDIIVFSKIEYAIPSDIDFAKYYIHDLNPNAIVFEDNWENLSLLYLESLVTNKIIKTRIIKKPNLSHNCSSFDNFESISIRPQKKFTKDELCKIFNNFNEKTFGNVIRVKGYLLLINNNTIKVDFVLNTINFNDLNINNSNHMIVIIGRDLKEEDLKELFV